MIWIHYTTSNPASRNTAEALMGKIGERGEGWEMVQHNCHVLEIEPREGFNIILSPHRAKSGIPALTAHTPGNWSSADFGGEPFSLSVAWPSFLYTIMKHLWDVAKDQPLDLVYEVDHHGPSSPHPTVFVELGSNEEQWEDKERAALLAEAVAGSLTLQRPKEVFVGIGGGHYATKFTRKAMEEGWVFAHIMPKHQVDAVGERLEEMLSQALERSVEPVKGFVVEKKGLNGRQRQRVRDALDSLGKEWFYI